MIRLNEAKDCCGCNACVQKCPANCISMHEDNEGFSYPKIDTDLCMNCGLYEGICPIINQKNKQKLLFIYASKNKNEAIQKHSSPGGIFSLLAKYVLSQYGIVFGTCFNDNWKVIHDYIETTERFMAFQGSKIHQDFPNISIEKSANYHKNISSILDNGVYNLKTVVEYTTEILMKNGLQPKWRKTNSKKYGNMQ